MQHAAMAARRIGVVQQAAMAVCIICKYFHTTVQHFACHPKWMHAVRSVAYTSRSVCYVHNFLNETCSRHKLYTFSGFQVKADKPEGIGMPHIKGCMFCS
jgi:hypothetical protein